MTRPAGWLLALAVLLALGQAQARYVEGARRTPPRSDGLILGVNPDDGDAAAAGQAVADAAGLTYSSDLGNGYVVLQARGEPRRAAAARLAIVAAMERGRSAGAGGGGPPDTTPLGEAVARAKVTTAEEDWIVLPMDVPSECASGPTTTDPCTTRLWGMNAINAPAMWARVTGATLPPLDTHKGGVIDTGVHFSHVELQNQLNSGLSIGFRSGSTASAADLDGHGTHVSGTIAARWSNTGTTSPLVGVVGNIDIVNCKFLWGSGGTTSDAVRCVDYMTKNGVTITNNSWGGGGFSSALYDAIKRACDAGGLFVAAAGNSGLDISSGTGSYPAVYNLPCVLPVAASDINGVLASWSNFGLRVPIAAPGVGIQSSVYDRKSNTREAIYSGTSMAAPHVTSAALMLKNLFPALNGTQLRSALVSTATARINTGGRALGGGLLNINAAYDEAAEMAGVTLP